MGEEQVLLHAVTAAAAGDEFVVDGVGGEGDFLLVVWKGFGVVVVQGEVLEGNGGEMMALEGGEEGEGGGWSAGGGGVWGKGDVGEILGDLGWGVGAGDAVGKGTHVDRGLLLLALRDGTMLLTR